MQGLKKPVDHTQKVINRLLTAYNMKIIKK